MTPPRAIAVLFAVTVVLATCRGPFAISQDDGSGSSRSDPSRATRPQTPAEFYNSFWRYIVKRDAAYNTWKVLAREPTEDGIENPHSTISKTYVDKVGSANSANLPNESILVREDYDSEKKRQSISVMYRVKDYDKVHGNWYWIKYLEDGSVARSSDGKTLAGKITSCIQCHAKAKGQDFVFSNDTVQGEGSENGKSAASDQNPKSDETKE